MIYRKLFNCSIANNSIWGKEERRGKEEIYHTADINYHLPSSE